MVGSFRTAGSPGALPIGLDWPGLPGFAACCSRSWGPRISRSSGALLLLVLGLPHPAAVALDTTLPGVAYAISNDSLGDWHDRWRSSSVEVGVLGGADSGERLPPRLGKLLEYRFRSDVLMPADIGNPHPSDRRHAGVLAFGVHSHAGMGDVEVRLGGDLVVTGSHTGLYDFQTRLHKILGFVTPNALDFQIDNSVRLEASAEFGRILRWGRWNARPFAGVRAGAEDLFRIGVDVETGPGSGGPAMRAVTTGHRVPYGFPSGPGQRFVAGADMAWVGNSIFLPESLGYERTSAWIRLRAGIHHTGRKLDVFYGLAWLGEEFEAQPEGQFVGSLQVRFRL